MNTDKTQIIRHSYSLKNFKYPNDITQLCRGLIIEQYVYAIKYTEPLLGTVVIMKYGKSMGGSKSPGERLYRQLANAPGWDVDVPRSPSGKDFEMICEDFSKKYNRIAYKDDLSFTIYDMSCYIPPEHVGIDAAVSGFEAELIKEHISFHGYRPIGNLKDESSAEIRLRNYTTFSEFVRRFDTPQRIDHSFDDVDQI